MRSHLHRFHAFPWAVLLLLLLSGSVRGQHSPVPGLDEYIQTALRQWNVPGLAIAIVQDDEVILQKGYGVRELGSDDLVDEHTIFAVASTTKAMTVACLGMLVDEGKLSWDDPVIKHLPEFQMHDPWVTREMTIRDLLTHRSGLSRGDLLWYGSSYDRAEVVDRVRFLEPSWSFRSRYAYQNIMYIAAGEVIEAVSGMPWDEFIRSRLFDPLGMESTSTSVSALEDDNNVASPHEIIEDSLMAVRWPNFDNVGPAGSVNSSAHDMAQWIRLNLARGVFDGTRLVSEQVIEEMQTPQIPIRRDSLSKVTHPMTNMSAYGLGWGISDYYGKTLISHSGWLDGMRTRVAMLPQAGVGVVIIMNGPRARLHWALALWVLDHYLGVERTDWSSIYLSHLKKQEEEAREHKVRREKDRIGGTTPALPLSSYSGTYENEMYGDMVVSLDKQELRISFGAMYRGKLEHRHYETFEVRWDDRSLGTGDILFTQDFDGTVHSLKWRGVEEFVRKDGSEP